MVALFLIYVDLLWMIEVDVWRRSGSLRMCCGRKEREGRSSTGKLFPYAEFTLQKEGGRNELTEKLFARIWLVLSGTQVPGTTILVETIVKCIRYLLPSVR